MIIVDDNPSNPIILGVKYYVLRSFASKEIVKEHGDICPICSTTLYVVVLKSNNFAVACIKCRLRSIQFIGIKPAYEDFFKVKMVTDYPLNYLVAVPYYSDMITRVRFW